jgi:hypothetical protein
MKSSRPSASEIHRLGGLHACRLGLDGIHLMGRHLLYEMCLLRGVEQFLLGCACPVRRHFVINHPRIRHCGFYEPLHNSEHVRIQSAGNWNQVFRFAGAVDIIVQQVALHPVIIADLMTLLKIRPPRGFVVRARAGRAFERKGPCDHSARERERARLLRGRIAVRERNHFPVNFGLRQGPLRLASTRNYTGHALNANEFWLEWRPYIGIIRCDFPGSR